MISFWASVLVIAGACLQAVALIPVRRLIVQLPHGTIRSKWYVMTALIMAFIAGYLGYAGAFWNQHENWQDLLVPAVFFFGAGFVWLTATLSLQTALDVRRMAHLERENITDPLIGIFNRRYLDRRLGEEIARAKRHAIPLSILMLDIDNFKRVNDTYGHQAGDLVLAHVGKLLLEAVRESDVVARYGGEELLVIAPNTPDPLAVTLAERIRHQTETHPLVLDSVSGKQIQITVSIGVAALDGNTKTLQKLVQHADEALYRAKQEGRNRVVVSKSNDRPHNP
jgi:diguanylate cyclase (GGDEF)-like protein